MDNQSRQTICRIAKEVRESTVNNSDPIKDMTAFIERLGGHVKAEKGLYTAYIERKNKEFYIHITDTLNDKTKNFKLAIYMGLTFIYMGYLTNQGIWENQTIKKAFTSKQYEAGYIFALEFLVQRSSIEDVILDFTDDKQQVDTIGLADYYNVPEHAIKQQCRFLHLIERNDDI